MTRFALRSDAIFDSTVQVPSDPSARGDLSVAALRDVDETFAGEVKRQYGFDSIEAVFSKIGEVGIDAMAAKIAEVSSANLAEVKAKLANIDGLVTATSYYRLLPESADGQFFLNGKGEIVRDPQASAPTSNVDKVDMLNDLAIALGNAGERPLDEVHGQTRRALSSNIEAVLGSIEDGGQNNQPVAVHQKSTPANPIAIPDNDPEGIYDVIKIEQAGVVDEVSVSVNIPDHTYIGDLRVELRGPNGETVSLHDKTGGSADGLTKTYGVSDSELGRILGSKAQGEWRLHVVDTAGQDSGHLVDWGLDLTVREEAGHTSTTSGVSTPHSGIGDLKTIEDTITIVDAGTIRQLELELDIDHTYIGDLVVELISPAPDSKTLTLHNKLGGSADDIKKTFLSVDNAELAKLVGTEAKGEWKIRVKDTASGDTGVLNRWKLSLGTGTGADEKLTERQERSMFQGTGAILRRLAMTGTRNEKEAAFDQLDKLIRRCPYQKEQNLLVASLDNGRGELATSSVKKLDTELSRAVLPKSIDYDYAFRIDYVDGKPVAHKRSYNDVILYGSEEDDLIFIGGIKMIEKEGFVEEVPQAPNDADSPPKSGLRKFVKLVNTDDPDAPCQRLVKYVGHMTVRNLLGMMDDPDIDKIDYDGHSNLGRNIEDALAHAKPLVGSKLCSFGACATSDRLPSLRDFYADNHKAQFINTYESTYFNWTEIDGKKVLDYSENMRLNFRLDEHIAKMHDWKACAEALDYATHSWSHSVQINYTNPGSLEMLNLYDLNRNGIPDGMDTVFGPDRVVPQEQISAQFEPKEPVAAPELLDAFKVSLAVQSIATFGRYNEMLASVYDVGKMRISGANGLRDLGKDGPMVEVSRDPITRGWKFTVNSWYSHASVEALRARGHAAFIKAAMAEGAGKSQWNKIPEADRKLHQAVYTMLFAASSLRFDNSYADDRIWGGVLKGLGLPESVPLSAFFHVIDEEHERPNDHLTGGYRNIAEVIAKLPADAVAAIRAVA